MQAEPTFANQPKEFWADVRTLSQKLGYTRRGDLIVPQAADVNRGYRELGLDPSHLIDGEDPTGYGATVLKYLKYRADILTTQVEKQLMDVDRARSEFLDLRRRYPTSRAPLPMNKQRGEKRSPAYLTCIVNMLIEASIGDLPCDYDPRELTAVTKDSRPLRTLARRVDGAFPSATDPVALWEIKEYYYTTTFGSRIADGVYESLLDGMELEELREHTGIHVLHYLIVDSHNTWWKDGKSYLCRMVDMVNMGYVDEVLFGLDVFDRIPKLAARWAQLFAQDERQYRGDR